MAKVHVLRNTGNKHYDIIVHADTPAGANLAGHAWQDVWVSDGRNVTRLSVGGAPGQIAQVEAQAIRAGTIMEFSFTIPAESGGAPPMGLSTMADRFVAQQLDDFRETYKYYGYTI